ncbi:MAG: protein kinase [Planctomycetaceae bacterium]
MEQIGEGGMGVVYMAEQIEPVRRRVALKIIKPGMDTKQVIARFEAERQALALMNHPHICKVFDGGTTESGRPYFVMELVRGMPITEFCDHQKLGTRDRLRLFLQVCQSVQHAHQRIIHRDLKPTNVLVTLHDGVPVPRIIDFGVAKALHQPLTDKTLFTNFAHMIGSPLYMSPEQSELSGLDVDTRSDVYSLGVLLFRLLTGNLPFDREKVKRSGYEEVLRMIREQEPPRPSVLVTTLHAEAQSTVSVKRNCDARTLHQTLKGELDWIVMKALEKNRTRRYESASALAADIEHHLADEPVNACPPSLVYQLNKLLRRHRVALTTTAIVALTLIIATTVSTLMAIHAMNASQLAEESLDELEQAAATTNMALQEKDAAWQKVATLGQSWYPVMISKVDRLIREQKYSEAQSHLDIFNQDNELSSLRGFEWSYLERHLAPNGQLLRGHTENVYSVSFSPDSRMLASASADYTVRLWEPSTGKLLRVLRGHSNDVNGVAFSPTNDLLATTSDDQTVRLWDPNTGVEIVELQGHQDMTTGLAFTPDGKLLVTGDAQGMLIFWDVSTTEIVRRVQAHPGRIHYVCFNSAGTKVATSGEDHVVRVWNMDPIDHLFSFDAPKGTLQLQSVAYQPGTDRLFACYRDGGMIRVWDTNSGELRSEFKTEHYLLGLGFSPDGEKLMTPAHRQVTVFNSNGEIFLQEADYPLGGNLTSWHATYSPDGRLLAAGARHDILLIRNDETPLHHLLCQFDSPITCLSAAPDGQSVAVGGPDGSLRWLDLFDGRDVFHQGAHDGAVTSARYSVDGRWLVTGGHDHQLKLWDANYRQLLKTIETLSAPIRDVAFSVDGNRLAASDGRKVQFWKTSDWTRIDTWPIEEVAHLGFSNKGSVIMAHGRMTLRSSKGLALPIYGPHNELVSMAVSADGTMAGFVEHTWNPLLLDLANYEPSEHPLENNTIQRLDRQRNHLLIAVGMTHDGRTMATVDSRGHLALWNTETGTKLLLRSLSELTRLPDLFLSVHLEFTPDDSALIVGLNPDWSERQLTTDEERPQGVVFVISHPTRLKSNSHYPGQLAEVGNQE